MADVNFIILKINGIDVSEMPNNEAVQMFLKAPEPMMLEVRRPTVDDLNKFYISSANLPIVSLSSPDKAPCRHQNDDENFSKFPAERSGPDVLVGVASEESNRSAPKKYFITTGVQTDTVLTEYIFSGSSIGDQSNDHIFDECLSPEIDIEEVTLRKAASSEKLGLTVSYSSGSDETDTCVEVYISDVIPNSVAGRDGRLRQGDQILQVNGRDVSNKTDTETLIAENKNAVTFLVSRYLYTDDDFNETYDDYDHRNLTYQNCSIAKNCTVDIRSSSEQTNTSSTSRSSSSHKRSNDREKKLPAGNTNIVAAAAAAAAAGTKEIIAKLDPINHFNIEAHLDSVNHELALLDSRVEGMMLHNGSKSATVTKPIVPTIGSNQNQTTYIYRMPIDNMKKVPGLAVDSATIERTDSTRSATIVQSARGKKYIESDTEHIYETIPEDMESEPFYCLPYVTADQNMVEQWLEMQAGNEPATLPSRSFPKSAVQMGGTSKYSSGQQQQHQLKATMKSNSSGEDHENSSSAYNTGGSCNSTNHLTLELNSNGDGYQRSIAGPYPVAINQQSHTDNIAQSYVQDINDNCEECQRQKKDKPLTVVGSPKHDRLKSPQKLRLLQKQQSQPQPQQSFSPFFSVITQPQCSADPSIVTSPKIPADTMYTNMANLKRTMLLQQKLFRQALIRQNSGTTTSAPTATTLPERPQFNAPNLSQYHFVSSQEVSAVTLKQYPCDEQMEWKVKRRQDGTRYIVRRPTRNRILRERAIRISAERNDITTEDDTISEIKTGRYWTKDERKKHFERAKERRLRQQLNIFNKFESDSNTMMIKQQSNEQQTHQKSIVSGGISNRCAVLSPSAALPAAMTPTIDSQTLYKKTMKKKKKDENATIADNDKKMMGLLSVTTV